MKLGAISGRELADRLHTGTLALRLGPFVARLRSDVASLVDDIGLMYGEFELADADGFADFHVEVAREHGLRRWLRPRARFYFDGRPSFIPLPVEQALPMLEWGLNWCVAAHAHQYLIIHAAVVETRGVAIVMPAPPGAGKSTLCAGLVNRGWRLISDELALYDFASGQVFGMARPINLKNRSIEIIRADSPAAILSAAVADTTKGTIALMRPPDDSVARALEPARPVAIVLPNFTAGAAVALEAQARAPTFMLLASQSFNYDIHGRRGFDAVGALVDSCVCHKLTYSSLDGAAAVLADLARSLAR